MRKRQFINTTVGRVIFNDHLPKELPFINGLNQEKGRPAALYYCLPAGSASKRTVQMLDELKEWASSTPPSRASPLGIDDMVIPGDKFSLVENTEKEVVKGQQAIAWTARITTEKRYNKVIAIWSDITGKSRRTKFSKAMWSARTRKASSIRFTSMADSGARDRNSKSASLSGMRGWMFQSPRASHRRRASPRTSAKALTVLQIRIGGFERRGRQALAAPWVGDEILQHGEAFADVRGDGRLDDFARGLGHQAAHAGELAICCFDSRAPGIGHDVNRIG